MNEVTAIVASIMRADADAVQVAANNLANADTAAYRRQLQVRHLGGSTFASQHTRAVTDLELPQTSVALDTRAGTFKNTAEPLDVAIQGDGYFAVSTASGTFLTRRGDFHVNDSGVLSAYTGDPVVGAEGTLKVPSGTVQIAVDGTVRVGTQVLGHLQAVQVDASSRLSERSDGLLEIEGGQEPTPTTSVQFHQGFLETSNIQPVQEMVRMLEAVRHFEAGQRYMRAYDEMLDKAIGDLGKL